MALSYETNKLCTAAEAVALIRKAAPNHWQAGTNNAAGAGVVSHTDYIHPVYGYSRFDGHLPEGFCRVKAEEAFKRSQRRFPS